MASTSSRGNIDNALSALRKRREESKRLLTNVEPVLPPQQIPQPLPEQIPATVSAPPPEEKKTPLENYYSIWKKKQEEEQHKIETPIHEETKIMEKRNFLQSLFRPQKKPQSFNFMSSASEEVDVVPVQPTPYSLKRPRPDFQKDSESSEEEQEEKKPGFLDNIQEKIKNGPISNLSLPQIPDNFVGGAIRHSMWGVGLLAMVAFRNYVDSQVRENNYRNASGPVDSQVERPQPRYSFPPSYNYSGVNQDAINKEFKS
jgi:hypothetical protein